VGKLLLQIGEKEVFDMDTGKIKGKHNNSRKIYLHRPSSFAVDKSNSYVYITDGYGNRFEQGKHEGHDYENGNYKGLENENNQWSKYGTDTGEDFDLTIINHANSPQVRKWN
jgi:hypothetical protein